MPGVVSPGDQVAISRFVEFTRAEWARLRASTPLPLTEPQLRPLVSLNERMSIDEVADVYLPLSRLLNLYVGATQSLHQATATFIGTEGPRVPFVIGIAGSVAVGKSTISRVLKALLSHWPSHPQVDLITTDGFLLPQNVLESRGITDRKGFPESYDAWCGSSPTSNPACPKYRLRSIHICATTSCPASPSSFVSQTS
jgi:type I pantothenate kinase